MDINDYIRTIGPVAVAAILSGGATYVVCHDKSDEVITALRDSISNMRDAERKALITQRVSRQMEDIAFEQKNQSDKQRLRAEEQSRIADMERGKAELERHHAEEERGKAEAERQVAVKAQREAVVAAKQADSMRVVAESQTKLAIFHMEEAQEAQAHADTLYYQALGRSLAQASIAQLGSGNRDIAELLAYSSYFYTSKYKGDLYKQDIFTALMGTANAARRQMGIMTGNVMDIEPCNYKIQEPNEDDTFMAITDYGEIARMEPKYDGDGHFDTYVTRTFFKNNEYLFQELVVKDSTAYVLDINGNIFKINTRTCETETPLPFHFPSKTMKPDMWRHIELMADGTIMVAGEHTLCWLDKDATRLLTQYYTDNKICEIGTDGRRLFVFYDNGTMSTFDQGAYADSVTPTPISATFNMPKKDCISFYYYHKDKQYHIMGCTDGEIYIYDRDMNHVTTLYGHKAGITDMTHLGKYLFSSSYDHNVCVWDIDNIHAVSSPVSIEYQQWPLCMVFDEPIQTLRVGLANGGLESVRISVEDNAESTHRLIDRDFTVDEWNYFIGPSVPYQSFKMK